jgi:hypothetical protein
MEFITDVVVPFRSKNRQWLWLHNRKLHLHVQIRQTVDRFAAGTWRASIRKDVEFWNGRCPSISPIGEFHRRPSNLEVKLEAAIKLPFPTFDPSTPTGELASRETRA